MENVTEFKYLERVMTAGVDDWSTVVGNLKRARESWGECVADIETGGGGFKGVGNCF